MTTIILLACACLIVRICRLSVERIHRLKLRPVAVSLLVAAAITPTSDLWTDLFLAVPWFAGYLGYEWAVARARSSAA